jgi:hypothetical protein
MSYITRQYLSKTGILLLILLFVVLLIPHGVLAAPGDYTPLEPIPVLGGGTVSLSSYIPNLVKLIIQIAGVLAVVMIVLGGVQYLSTDAIGGKSEGKQKIENAIYGLLLAIGAYVILNTINPGTLQLQLIINPITGSSTPPTATSTPGGGTWASDATERADLASPPNRVSVNKANCSNIGQTNCTSVTGLRQGIINLLKAVKQACGCTVIITGGTEYWSHSAGTQHKPGGNVVDLSLQSGLVNFIKANGVKGGATGCSTGPDRWTYGGATYVDEKVQNASGAWVSPPGGPHFHVCFN